VLRGFFGVFRYSRRAIALVSSTNPLLLVALASSFDAAGCMVGTQTGRACLFNEIGEMIVGACLLPPLFGVGLRWLLRPRPLLRPPPMPPRPPG
jgi:hypothetical protein